MLEHRFNRFFPDTDAQAGDLAIEVVHFDIDDRPVKRHFLSLDYLLSPLKSAKSNRKGLQG
ncbi:hypothetical protein TG4357_03641 [Thalassovita gelatinovora]|uniref:Uncharacterized protein n=1 Tax=Thalassovita gelatinovora TaxID=53501 RepID=A0A0P1G5L0_THAGE|nr:hypothetical protein [Thalassovita gelatinovora]QIZ78986.1 hypothetical protein HFZ77_00090 [Thalassovita gelatinovora]CUH68517.1 hypothetical protein TG4357_03641 [Thalassovita gelatinovora]SEQ53895.1 hypothetical protein SAMN04488043_106102 [Thalassovita gelatinovora]